MRFILNARRKTPSFKAGQDAYVFMNMAVGQLSAVIFAGLLLWTFMPFVDIGIFASVLLIFLAIAFYLSIKSIQLAQLVFIFSVFGIELLMLISNPFLISPNTLIAVFAFIDVAIIVLVYWLNIRYPIQLIEK